MPVRMGGPDCARRECYRGGRVSLLQLAILALTAFAGTAQAQTQSQPAFGDSGWVAPIPVSDTLALKNAPDVRVGKADHEPVGETILRTPFRILFLPLRAVAYGLEGAAGFAGPSLTGQIPRGIPLWKLIVGPAITLSGSAGLGLGTSQYMFVDRDRDAIFSFAETWSTKDHRRVRGRLDISRGDRLGFSLTGAYAFRPNYAFYGLGNFSQTADRSIYLQESGDVRATVYIGGRLTRQLRLSVGYNSMSARIGYNGSPGALDQFAPEQFPFLLRGSRAWSFGAGGDYAILDDTRDPSRGVHGRAEVQQFKAVDESGIDYRYYYLEGRFYVPVWSKRRVLAFRAVHQVTDPADDVPGVPFYRQPETTDMTRFAAYAAHRFADNQLLLGHAEYRWIVMDRLWMFGMAQVGEVQSTRSRFRWADVHESYGGGFRLAITERAVIRAQLAGGSEGLKLIIDLKDDF
jgi:hypothetical protein